MKVYHGWKTKKRRSWRIKVTDTPKKIYWRDKCSFFAYEKLIYEGFDTGRRQLRIHKSYINEISILCEVKNAGEEAERDGTCYS